MKYLLLLGALLASPALGQTIDPQFCQDAADAIADQRNQAFNAAAGIKAQLVATQKQVAALQKEVADLKAKMPKEPDKKDEAPK